MTSRPPGRLGNLGEDYGLSIESFILEANNLRLVIEGLGPFLVNPRILSWVKTGLS